ncbi:stalk domain-containing protein [Paenibacillus sp. NPDC057967]|uniref:stalk domain-containing protein n=1 Tax=Paenibacillus sp. NPDC057967 TaxID=3346293 RepID=UPI0036D7643E
MNYKKWLLSSVILLLLSFSPSLSSNTNATTSKPNPKWVEIAVGIIHSLGVKSDGTVWNWGNITTYRGSLGSETNLFSLVPVQVPSLSNVVRVAGGQTHSLALRSDGTVWAWGGNLDGQLGDGTTVSRDMPAQVGKLTDIVDIAADWTSSYAVQADGTLWVWGGFFPDKPTNMKNITDVQSISTGYSSYAVLKKDGTVIHGYQPEKVIEGLDSVTQIAISSFEVYALKENGTVWFWPDEDGKAKKLDGITDVKAIQASGGGPLMLKKDGTVWSQGHNVGGQLGIGSYEASEVPVQAVGLKKMTSIAAHGAGYRAMAIRADGTLWAWGNGYTGDGTKWYRTKPVGIKGYPDEQLEPDPIFVELDGSTLAFDTPPTKQNGRVMVPLRAIFDALGAEIHWDANTKTITATKDRNTVILTVGENFASINGVKEKLDASPVIIKGTTFVPVRFIGSAFGNEVQWDAVHKTVMISTAP